MMQECSRFKFITAFVFYPVRSLLSRIGLRYEISEIVNDYYREKFNAVSVSERAVILPHCLIDEKCPARFSKEDGILCVKCKRCRCGEIRLLCEERGWQFYLSPSSGFTKRLVERKEIRAALGAACDYEIDKGIRETRITLGGVLLKRRKVVPQAIMTTRYDCLNNDVDWDRLRRIILNGGGGPGPS